MNYLSHFFVDHQPANHYYNTGLILPDLAKSHVKQFKSPQMDPSMDAFMQLQNGCLTHYLRDKQFHASTWFVDLNVKVSDKIKRAGFSNQLNRKWFLAHVLTELMLDRIIVKSLPACNDLFYTSLRSIDVNVLLLFLNQFQVSNPELFIQRFEHFRQVAFVGYYPDTNKFVYSLTRILMRVGLPEMQANDQLILANLCDEVEAQYFSNHKDMMQQLKQVFNA